MPSNEFPPKVVESLLIKCHRHCCLCHRFSGTAMIIHHIDQNGSGTEENGIPLCLSCHQEVGAYNPKHPIGRKFTPSELKKHRDQWFAIVSISPWDLNPPPQIDEKPSFTSGYANHSLSGQTIQLGATATTTDALEHTRATIEIAESEINEFIEKLGYDFKFNFIFMDNQGTEIQALENTKKFKTMGIDFILGHGRSSQCNASLSYINENNMILISSSSTSPILSIAGDNLYRMCPNDFVQAAALAAMWESWDVDTILIIQRGDTWGDGLYNLFSLELKNRDIEELGRLRYSGSDTDRTNIIQQANHEITSALSEYNRKKIGIQFFSFSEIRTLQIQASSFPNLLDVIWMTTESGGRSQRTLDEAGQWAVKTRHFSPLMSVPYNERWYKYEEKYFSATGVYPSYYDAALYDAAWVLALAILQSSSMDAHVVKKSLRDVAALHYGITGWCKLDETGDRTPQMYDIWGFYEDPDFGGYEYRTFGTYNGNKIEVMWDYPTLFYYADLIPPKLNIDES